MFKKPNRDKLIRRTQSSFSGMTLRTALYWRDLDIPLKITVLVASLGGVGGMIATMKILSLPVDHSAPPIYLLFSIEAFISFAGAFCILRLPLSHERRGILGFATFVVSLPSTIWTSLSLASMIFLNVGTGMSSRFSSSSSSSNTV